MLTVVSAVVWGVTMLRKVWSEWIRPIVYGIRDFLDDWRGKPARPGHDAESGVMERLDMYDQRIEGLTSALGEHEAAIAEVRHHVQPNHGTSAHDRLMAAIGDLRELVADTMAEVGELRRDYTRALRHNHPNYDPDAVYPGDSDDY